MSTHAQISKDIIVLCNGLAPLRHQAITGGNGDPDQCHIISPIGFSELANAALTVSPGLNELNGLISNAPYLAVSGKLWIIYVATMQPVVMVMGYTVQTREKFSALLHKLFLKIGFCYFRPLYKNASTVSSNGFWGDKFC